MSKRPYALLSDLHCHAWSQHSTVLVNGRNSRLQMILDEIDRAAQEVREAGGDTIYIAGDLVHTRGSMDPEVFNPLFEKIKELAEDSFIIRIIPGNHDLKGRDTTELGNAIQTLGTIEGVEVVTAQTGRLYTFDDVLMLPWHATKDALRATVKDITDAYGPEQTASTDLIIHVGIDGMLDGVPPSGLSAKEVASWGFRRVFAGDYHNHRVAEDGKVISIGATCHQQWGDIGTKAGFLIVYEDRFEYRASHAPSFVDLTGDVDPSEYFSIVDGNYVRVRGMKLTDAEVNTFRKELIDLGARGVTFNITREVVSARGSTTVTKAATLDQSVDSFIDQMKDVDPDHVPAIKEGAADILTSIRSITA